MRSNTNIAWIGSGYYELGAAPVLETRYQSGFSTRILIGELGIPPLSEQLALGSLARSNS